MTIDAIDEPLCKILGCDVVNKAERAIVLSRVSNPGAGDGRKICRYGNNGATGSRANQEGQLTEQLTGACCNGKLISMAIQESRTALTQRLEESNLFLVGHSEIAVTGSVVKELMH